MWKRLQTKEHVSNCPHVTSSKILIWSERCVDIAVLETLVGQNSYCYYYWAHDNSNLNLGSNYRHHHTYSSVYRIFFLQYYQIWGFGSLTRSRSLLLGFKPVWLHSIHIKQLIFRNTILSGVYAKETWARQFEFVNFVICFGWSFSPMSHINLAQQLVN